MYTSAIGLPHPGVGRPATYSVQSAPAYPPVAHGLQRVVSATSPYQNSAARVQTYQQPYVASQQRVATPVHTYAPQAHTYAAPTRTVISSAGHVATGATRYEGPESWKAIAEAEGKDKQGWVNWNQQVLLRQASKKYGYAVTLPHGHSVPFNECAQWYYPGGQDHWFEIDLNTERMIAEIGEQIPGRIFTTRMPRCLDDPGDADATNKARFMKKVKDNNIKKVFPLIEDEEPAKYKSKDLFDFYKHECKMEVLRRPVEDYNCPSFEIENQAIADLSIALKLGENCLVHCLGGSGRTGTIIIGALENLGVLDPITLARGVKSVYLDIAEQEEFLNRQRTIITDAMVHKSPDLAKNILMMHLEKLANATQLVQTQGQMSSAEVHGLKMVYDLAAPRTGLLHMGHGDHISVNELLALSPKIAPKIHPDALLHLLTQLDPNLDPQAGADDKVITFDLLQMLMQLNSQQSQEDYDAKTKAQALAK